MRWAQSILFSLSLGLICLSVWVNKLVQITLTIFWKDCSRGYWVCSLAMTVCSGRARGCPPTMTRTCPRCSQRRSISRWLFSDSIFYLTSQSRSFPLWVCVCSFRWCNRTCMTLAVWGWRYRSDLVSTVSFRSWPHWTMLTCTSTVQVMLQWTRSYSKN